MMTNPKKSSAVRFAFFGTSHIAVYALEALAQANLMPALVVTQPPKPKGRGLEEKPTQVELWARDSGIPVAHDTQEFEAGKWDVAIVVDYGNMLPKNVLDVPRCGFLNVHPSLLPRLRGASPIRSAILNDERTTGVSVMLVSEGMDEGPIVAQKKIEVTPWPIGNAALETMLMQEGGKLLAQILPQWVAGEVDAHGQNHDVATYAEKITKEDGLLDLSADAYKNLLKIRAYEGWPGTYAFFERNGKSASRRIRVGIIDAHIENGKLVIARVKPEGKKEMGYEEFVRSGAKPATN
ncbi:MAG: methionyl-tRNA formyltransferase [bacterium]|nr:methionyl-tRNA formyltransferase [bacterium]